MAPETAGSSPSLLVLSLVLGPILYIGLLKMVRTIIPGDTGFLLASLIATFGGVSAPWLVVRFWRMTTANSSGTQAEA